MGCVRSQFDSGHPDRFMSTNTSHREISKLVSSSQFAKREIEAESEDRVQEVAQQLGLDSSALIDKGMVQVILERLNLKPGRIQL